MGTTGGRQAAFFDVDQTLVRGASSYHLTREMYRRGFFTRSDLFFAVRQSLLYVTLGEGQARVQRVVQRALATMAGHSVAEVVALGSELVTEMYNGRLFPGSLALLRQHQEMGHEVWLMSTTPQEVTDMLAHHLHATGSLGTRVRRRHGIYEAVLETPIMHGQAKADAAAALAAERGLDLARCWAYSDSKSDLPLLELVGHPCAVNPDPVLRSHARERGWPIVDFRRARGLFHRRWARWSASLAGAAWAATVVARRLTHR